jgi:hypothetical protein
VAFRIIAVDSINPRAFDIAMADAAAEGREMGIESAGIEAPAATFY